MSSKKVQQSKEFSFFSNTPNTPNRTKSMVLTVLSIPSNDILGLGALLTLGALCVWLVQILITPTNAPPTPIAVTSFNSQSSPAFFVLLLTLVSIGIIFWIVLALYTRKATLLIWGALTNSKLFMFFQIGILILLWLPLSSILAVQNPTYRSSILVLCFSALSIASTLFIIEDALRRHWKISY